jgi:hypothetical protein
MYRVLAFIACCGLLTPAARGDEPLAPDGTPLRVQGGLIFVRHGNQTIWSLGGGIFPRKIKMTTATPEGPVVTRFSLPPNSPIPLGPVAGASTPASLQIAIPDPDGLLYIEGNLVRGKDTLRHLQSPPLPPGQACLLHLTAAFRVGDNLLIEDQQVQVQGGANTTVTFTGSKAISVPLPANAVEAAPAPRRKSD